MRPFKKEVLILQLQGGAVMAAVLLYAAVIVKPHNLGSPLFLVPGVLLWGLGAVWYRRRLSGLRCPVCQGNIMYANLDLSERFRFKSLREFYCPHCKERII